MLPSSIQEAEAIKHKTPVADNTGSGSTSTASSSSSTAASPTSPASSCISYPTARTITVSCTSARLSDVFNQIHDNSILTKQSSPGIVVSLQPINDCIDRSYYV